MTVQGTIIANFVIPSQETLKQDLTNLITTFHPSIILLEKMKTSMFPKPMQIKNTRIFTRLTLKGLSTKTLTNTIPRLRKQTHWLSIEPVNQQQTTWLALHPMVDAIHVSKSTASSTISKHFAKRFWRTNTTIEFDLTPLILLSSKELGVLLRSYRKILKKLSIGKTNILLLSGNQGFQSIRPYRSLQALSMLFGLGSKHLYHQNKNAAFLQDLLNTNTKKLQHHIINGEIEVLPSSWEAPHALSINHEEHGTQDT